YESRRIADLGYEAVGIDFSAESLEIARQKNPTISFYQEDMLCDYSYIGAVDAIIVIAGLVHVETEKLPLAFEQMRKVLKEDGKLLVSIREGIGKMEDRSLCEIEGVQYDRNFIAHTLEELKKAAEGLFSYQCEMKSDMQVWKNYVFSRI
ncbi:MAG: class I SAM-dependent methyltransferase, partial [Acetatifactor sp.]|nr:class I SAM-dependent methyltransferase [Acetatifactor sp.]